MGGVGILAVITSFIGLSYYSVLGGWVIRYIFSSATNASKDGAAFFADFTADTGSQLFYYVIFMILTVFIVARGVQKGIEKACKVMMPLLLVCIIAVAIRSCTLPGAGAGIEFFLKPDFSKLTPGAFLERWDRCSFSVSGYGSNHYIWRLSGKRSEDHQQRLLYCRLRYSGGNAGGIRHTASGLCLWI